MPFKPITDEQYETSVAEAERRSRSRLLAEGVRYDPERDVVEITLSDTFSFCVPRSALTEWSDVPVSDYRTLRLSGTRNAIAVGDHDVHISIMGLFEAAVPDTILREMFGRRGGHARTPAKASAARANGALGGRPKKAVVEA